MELLTILIILTASIALPLGEFARVDFGNGIAFTFLDLGVFLIVSTWVIQRLVKMEPINFWQIVKKPLVIFFVFAICSLLINLWWLSIFQRIVAALYLVRFGMYSTLLVMAKSKGNKNLAMVIGGGLILLAGFVQYFFYPSLANLKYAGWDQHLYRLFSTFLDPNFAGAFLVLYFLFITDWLVKNKGKKRKVLLGLIGIVTVFGIVLTYSRAAYLMFIVGTVVYFWLKGYKKWMGIIIVSCIIIGLLGLGIFQKKSEGTNLFRTASTFARVGNAGNALTIFSKSPLLGVGYDTYRYIQRKYGFVTTDTGHGGAGADNSFLLVLATTGIIGFFFYIAFWWEMCKALLKKKSFMVFGSLIAVFVGSLFNNLLFYPFILFWIFLIESTLP